MVVWYFSGEWKKTNSKKKQKNICKHIRIRLIGGCVNNPTNGQNTQK